jgi:hypothetical protein
METQQNPQPTKPLPIWEGRGIGLTNTPIAQANLGEVLTRRTGMWIQGRKTEKCYNLGCNQRKRFYPSQCFQTAEYKNMPINRDYAKFLKNFHSKKLVSRRDARYYVLKEYAKCFTAISDVAIELLTGAGKTLISLLVANLSANKTLARQRLQEAEARHLQGTVSE